MARGSLDDPYAQAERKEREEVYRKAYRPQLNPMQLWFLRLWLLGRPGCGATSAVRGCA